MKDMCAHMNQTSDSILSGTYKGGTSDTPS